MSAALLEKMLARERVIVAVCLGVITILAWSWLVRTSAPDMASSAGMDGMDMPGMMDASGMAASFSFRSYFPSAFVMWFVMMVAMMLPSASPMILVYAGVARRSGGSPSSFAPTLVFAAIYAGVWAAFSLIAAVAQWTLAEQGLIAADTLALHQNRLAGGLLIAAGIYQATPLKRACLGRCRSPLSFLMSGWRPGWRGAVRLGLSHGLSCLGCCWMLMALLFVGGVMNLALVAVLAIIVLIEKVAPIGKATSLAIGVLASGVGLWLLAIG